MRKIIALMLVLSFVFSGVCSAQVYRETDSFNGTTIVSSQVQQVLFDPNWKSSFQDGTKLAQYERFNYEWDNVNLFKVIYKDGKPSINMLELYVSKLDWWFFNEDNIQIKIDDDKIYDLKVVKVKREVSSLNTCRTNCYIIITPEQIDLIKNANNIVARVNFSNRNSVTWTITSEMLDEWKQVINATL